MDLHNGLDIEVYDLRPTDLHYYYYYYYYCEKKIAYTCAVPIVSLLKVLISISECDNYREKNGYYPLFRTTDAELYNTITN